MTLSQRLDTLTFDPRGTAMLQRAEKSKASDQMIERMWEDRKRAVRDLAREHTNRTH